MIRIQSKGKVPDPFLPIAEPSSILWLDNWKEVVEVLPNAEVQCEEKVLKKV
jgi:hypothetical protein